MRNFLYLAAIGLLLADGCIQRYYRDEYESIAIDCVDVLKKQTGHNRSEGPDADVLEHVDRVVVRVPVVLPPLPTEADCN